MTSDLSDVEGNWMANGMRLISQVIGALLAIILMTEGDGDYAATEMWITEIGDQYWMAIGMIAAGAVWWQIHTRCNSEWASGIGLMALASAMTLSFDFNPLISSILPTFIVLFLSLIHI